MGENVNFVSKEINPPKFPQTRPLGNFGAVWHKNFTRKAKKKAQLIRRIESKMKEFDVNFVESLLEGVKAKPNR